MNFDELLALLCSKNSPRLCTDSRLVKTGDIFVAVKGTVCDGHDFIDQAIANGAKYIVCQNYKPSHESPAASHEIIIVQDSAKAAASLAQAGTNNPASKLINLAVTGTNGKTTVAFLTQSVIRHAGQKCGLIGTIICDTGLDTTQSNLTTPDCLDIARAQQQMLKAGANYMVIEASSHALSQNRLFGIDFKAAAFTNLAGDHLDYHKTKQQYLAAKATLFQALSPNATAVLNKQSPEAEQIAEKTNAKILWYAVDEPARLSTHIESVDINGTVFTLEYAGQTQKVNTPLPGRHNVSNHNPRTEDPNSIINEIVAGFKNPAAPRITVEPDRKKAVQIAIKTAAKDDIVLMAGKGHETYQIIGTKKFDFSDKNIALACLANQK